MQSKAARIIRRIVRVTFLLALDIEGYFFSLYLQLEKLAGEAILRLVTNSSFKTLF